jgi:glucose-6-phosphate 1-dehydrogenase
MIIVAFGLTGDLMRTKIIPALFNLFQSNSLPSPLKIIGLSRRAWSDNELREYIRNIIKSENEQFLDAFEMIQGDVEDAASYEAIKKQAREETNILYYLSVAPDLYGTIVDHIAKSGLPTKNNGTAWVRMILEKPFGYSLKSAEDLERAIEEVFTEEQIYRIDHYLGKEVVKEIARLPNKESIARVHIKLLETIGVEDRGALYDHLGALRDVGQNHLLELAALITAKGSRTGAIENFKILSHDDVARATVRAQYDGYPAAKGVDPNSQTETYFKIKTALLSDEMPVEIVLESGKYLATPRKEISIDYRDGTTRAIPLDSKGDREYEALIEACIEGSHSQFVSYDEARALWHFIDPILASWQSGTPPLLAYPPRSDEILMRPSSK